MPVQPSTQSGVTVCSALHGCALVASKVFILQGLCCLVPCRGPDLNLQTSPFSSKVVARPVMPSLQVAQASRSRALVDPVTGPEHSGWPGQPVQAAPRASKREPTIIHPGPAVSIPAACQHALSQFWLTAPWPARPAAGQAAPWGLRAPANQKPPRWSDCLVSCSSVCTQSAMSRKNHSATCAGHRGGSGRRGQPGWQLDKLHLGF